MQSWCGSYSRSLSPTSIRATRLPHPHHLTAHYGWVRALHARRRLNHDGVESERSALLSLSCVLAHAASLQRLRLLPAREPTGGSWWGRSEAGLLTSACEALLVRRPPLRLFELSGHESAAADSLATLRLMQLGATFDLLHELNLEVRERLLRSGGGERDCSRRGV